MECTSAKRENVKFSWVHCSSLWVAFLTVVFTFLRSIAFPTIVQTYARISRISVENSRNQENCCLLAPKSCWVMPRKSMNATLCTRERAHLKWILHQTDVNEIFISHWEGSFDAVQKLIQPSSCLHALHQWKNGTTEIKWTKKNNQGDSHVHEHKIRPDARPKVCHVTEWYSVSPFGGRMSWLRKFG